jgi:hypothetical protein
MIKKYAIQVQIRLWGFLEIMSSILLLMILKNIYLDP